MFFKTTKCTGASVAALGLSYVALGQQPAELMRDDPRLIAGFHFAEFGGYQPRLGKDKRTVELKRKEGESKEWTCQGIFEQREGTQHIQTRINKGT